MTKDLRFYFTVFAFNLAKRKTARQRKFFLDYLGGVFQAMGYRCTVDQVRVGASAIQNVVVGDPAKAERVFVGISTTLPGCCCRGCGMTPWTTGKTGRWRR